MTLRAKMLAILDVVLRVPPVFFIDILLINGFQMPLGKVATTHNESANAMHNLYYVFSGQQAEDYEIYRRNKTETGGDAIAGSIIATDDTVPLDLWEDFLSMVIMLQGFFAAVALFLLSTKNLLSIYVWVGSILVIISSYSANEAYVQFALSTKAHETSVAFELFQFNTPTVFHFLGNYLLQVFLAILFCFMSSTSQDFLSKRFVGVCFILPTVLSLWSSTLSDSVLLVSSASVAALACFYLLLNLLFQARSIYNSIHSDITWARNMLRHYGFYTLIENQWNRLHVMLNASNSPLTVFPQVPQVLRVFWLTRLTEQALVIVADTAHDNFLTSGSAFVTFESAYVFSTAKELMVRGCETVIAVLGMTSILSSITHHFGSLMQSFLVVEDPEDRSIGTVSAVLFFILALQTGLTSMDPEKRFLRLYRNLCLLSTAILHFIHNMVSPLLFNLSASRNMSWSKHSRALIVCAFLIAFPAWFLHFLWSTNQFSTWLLAVSAFSIEVIVKVVISLLIYTLFMIDAFRNTMWERLDDYVYYVRATGNTIEFIFGIFLFINGAYILIFESSGTIRALMMCIHAYFNIYLQAKTGWRTFMKRRQAVGKINSLPEATPQQLEAHNDVCAICYQELESARITKCNHFSHGVCLRKWLYVQDICPLCHATLYVMNEEPAPPAAEPNQNQPHAENNVQNVPNGQPPAGQEPILRHRVFGNSVEGAAAAAGVDEQDIETNYEDDEEVELQNLIDHEHQD